MARSLRRYGQISPVVVCLREGLAVLIDGFKRLSAARSLKGFGTLSARRIEVDERGAKAAMYGLNRTGRHFGELEEAWLVQALVREDGLSQVEVAVLLGRHKSWVCRRLAMMVNLFSYVLGYSRRQYLHFAPSQDLETTIREHVRAFEHLGGVAATCLYDNLKAVVSRYEDGEPVYNTRFLTFATHYGFRPVACRPRRPRTKGKVERPYEVAEVVYRTVDAEGMVSYAQNRYSAPWHYLGQVLPLRITEQSLTIYGPRLELLARHLRFPPTERRQQRRQAEHLPPRDVQKRREVLRERFARLGPLAVRFLEGLLDTQRCGWDQAQKVLTLLGTYRREDLLVALERAVRYGAFAAKSIERILAVQARPKTCWDRLAEEDATHLKDLLADDPTPPRPATDYQHLLFEESDHHGQTEEDDPGEDDGQPCGPPA